MLEESGCSLSEDMAIALGWHLTPDEGLHKLVIIESAKALLELGHQLVAEQIWVETLHGLFEQPHFSMLIEGEG